MDRLIECNGVTYTYDALGRRLAKNDERYLYHGLEEIATYKNGVQYAVKIGPPNRPAFIILQGRLFIPLYDAKGSLRLLIHEKTHEVFNQYLFDAFGTPIEVIERFPNPWRYALKHYDPESSLIYFGKRYYNPATKEWITEDPLGSIDTLNYYAFVRNNPLRYVDYTGLVSQEVNDFFKFLESLKVDTYSPNEATPYTVGSQPLPPHKKVLYVNGIKNSYSDAKDTAKMFSDYSNSREINGVHSPSCGFNNDINWCLEREQKPNAKNRVAEEVAEQIRNFDYQNRDDLNAKILIAAHSGGGLDVKATAALLTEKERQRVQCITFASAEMIPNKMFYSVANYAIKGDFVPRRACNKADARGDDYNIVWLKPTAWYSVDRHSIRNEPFQPKIREHLKDYFEGR